MIKASDVEITTRKLNTLDGDFIVVSGLLEIKNSEGFTEFEYLKAQNPSVLLAKTANEVRRLIIDSIYKDLIEPINELKQAGTSATYIIDSPAAKNYHQEKVIEAYNKVMELINNAHTT